MRAPSGRLIFAVLLVVAASPSASAFDVRVGMPLRSGVASDRPLAWRGADGRNGKGHDVAAGALAVPARLRGDGVARADGRDFPLPADVVAFDGARYVVVVVDFDDYLAGVVPNEMHPDWPTEALKAQAVLARTYAMGRMRARRRAAAPLDVIAGTADQEYRWRRDPAPAMRALVRATSGLVLTADGRHPAEVFYHSCCGGRTADAAEVWGRSVAGIGPVEDPRCTVCPNYFWRLDLLPDELGGQVGLGTVREVRVSERGASGRATRVWLTDDERAVEYSGQELRARLGPERLRSQLFQVGVIEEDGVARFRFSGSGSGHGIGLCQFGAKAMAEAGHNAREILAAYFPTLTVEKMSP